MNPFDKARGMARGAVRYHLNPLRLPQIVLAAGMNRSGSTLLYNAARLMLSERGPLSCGWIDDWHSLERQPTMLVKLHDFEPDLVSLSGAVFYSFRDVRDVLASAQRIWNIAPTAESAAYHIAQYRSWIKAADLVVRYETLIADQDTTLRRLARVIGAGSADTRAIAAALDAMRFEGASDGTKPYDATNLMHRGHRTDGRHGSWEGALDTGLVREIEAEHRDWFVANGYPLTA